MKLLFIFQLDIYFNTYISICIDLLTEFVVEKMLNEKISSHKRICINKRNYHTIQFLIYS